MEESKEEEQSFINTLGVAGSPIQPHHENKSSAAGEGTTSLLGHLRGSSLGDSAAGRSGHFNLQGSTQSKPTLKFMGSNMK